MDISEQCELFMASGGRGGQVALTQEKKQRSGVRPHPFGSLQFLLSESGDSSTADRPPLPVHCSCKTGAVPGADVPTFL